MTRAAAPTPLLRRAYLLLTGTGGAETAAVREARLLTLVEPRALAIFTFLWTQLLAWTTLAVSGSLLPLAWVVADIAVFSVRLTLSYRHDAAARDGRALPREAMVATELAGFTLVSVALAASLSVGHPLLSIVLAIVATGMAGYVTARLAAFPRLASFVLYLGAITFAVGAAFSPIPDAWAIGLLMPGVAAGFQMLTFHNHRILVGSLTAQQENRRLSLHDPLTGLANRLHLYESLAELHRPGAPSEMRRLAVLCLDLDGFKCVNDEHGHPAGDLLLKTVAERLVAAAAPGDLVARLGGDEFVVLLPDAGRPEAVDLAARLVDSLSRPYALGDASACVGASIGISLGPDHGADPQDLLDCADRALYDVKRSGKGRWQLHDDPGLARIVA